MQRAGVLLMPMMLKKTNRPVFNKFGYKTVEIHKCSGHCCKAFSLPYSFEEIKHQKRLVELGKKVTYK